MVWFQCEDCGDNLKKPKLPNHFRACSASKLSCIDCGQVFRQGDVDSHTQCITEAEKYGPKGQASNGQNAKPKNNSKQKPEVDINVGLSDRPPWLCSLCNTKATSKQTLLLHADGKKHRAKARAYHAANQQSSITVEVEDSAENKSKQDVSYDKDLKEGRDCESSKLAAASPEPKVVVNAQGLSKKRNNEASENGRAVNGGKGEIKKARCGEKRDDGTYSSFDKEDKEGALNKLRWKKLISSALKSNPEGVLKFRKLMKLVVKSIEEDDCTEDKILVSEILERKINSSSRFILEGKYVRLVG